MLQPPHQLQDRAEWASDAARVGELLAWGTDLMWAGDAWSNARAKNHARHACARPVPAALSKDQVQYLVKQLRSDGLVVSRGRTRAGRWFAAGVERDPN